MSAPGHCRHCRDGCTLGDTCEFRHVNENWTAAWDDECCPACDEAERIADWIDTHDVAVMNLPADAAVAVMQSILAARIRDGVG